MRKRSEKHQKRQKLQKQKQNKGRSKQLTGRVQKNPRGFAFLLPEDRTQRDIYVSRNEAQFLMNNDIVLYTVKRGGSKPSAVIDKIVKRGQKEIVGRVIQIRRTLAIETENGEAYPLNTSQPIAEGEWVIGEIDEYPSPKSNGRINLVERLGSKLGPQMDVKIACAKFSLATEFPRPAIEDAREGERRAEAEVKRIKGSKRRDLRDLPFVTIDGEDAKDFDDAILVEQNKGSEAFTLYVSIADVSFFVRPGSALDTAARRRGTSVYFPGTCVPMLPEALSNELCSLKPREERLALTAEIHLDRDGVIIDAKFYESLIKTARRITYNELHQFYEGDKSKLDFLSVPLNAALALFKKMMLQRKGRGVLDFELPETRVEVDEKGKPTRLYRAERFESHKLIEEFMIAANQVVAAALRKSNTGALYRVHETPEPSTVDDVNQLMRSLGISKMLKDVSPRSLSQLLASTADVKGSRTLHQAILRMQKQARYEPDPKGHFGLALADYTHFTSPIRRYPDLVVHRSLKKLIGADRISDKRYEGEDYLVQAGMDTSDLERRAMEAERFVTRRKQCWYMLEKIGEIHLAEIGSVIEKGLFVEIPALCVEGFVPIDSFPDRYVFDDKKVCFRRSPGHTTLSIGDNLTVRIAQVDVEQGEITLTPEES